MKIAALAWPTSPGLETQRPYFHSYWRAVGAGWLLSRTSSGDCGASASGQNLSSNLPAAERASIRSRPEGGARSRMLSGPDARLAFERRRRSLEPAQPRQPAGRRPTASTTFAPTKVAPNACGRLRVCWNPAAYCRLVVQCARDRRIAAIEDRHGIQIPWRVLYFVYAGADRPHVRNCWRCLCNRSIHRFSYFHPALRREKN